MDTIFPKDIVVCIYKIVHKDFVSKLNKEYHKRVGIVLNSDLSYNSTSYRFDCTYHLKYYNYRCFDVAPSLKYAIGYTKTWDVDNGFWLCPKYYYSSGMSHPHGYKMIPKF